MTHDQSIEADAGSPSVLQPKHSKKTKIASFSRRDVAVTMKMVSQFDRDAGEYNKPTPKISLVVNGKYNRILADPGLLKDLGCFLMELGEAIDGLDLPMETPCAKEIRRRVQRCQEMTV